MSSILKALEKVDEARHSKRIVGRSALAKGSHSRPSWVLPACVLGGAALAALATFGSMGGFARLAAGNRQTPESALSASSPAPVLPAVTLSPAAVPPIAKALPAPVVGKPSKSAPLGLPAKALPVRSVKLAAKASRPPLVAHPVSPKQARPELRVTGIAWEKDSVANAALVNGQPVQQGSMVNGYKVVEILADKVRFSGDKGSLDVPLGGGE